jgi:hypothetical protein
VSAAAAAAAAAAVSDRDSKHPQALLKQGARAVCKEECSLSCPAARTQCLNSSGAFGVDYFYLFFMIFCLDTPHHSSKSSSQ